MALPLLHAGTGAGGVPDVGALKWSSGGAFIWSDDDYIVPSLDLNFALFKDIRPRIGPTPTFTRASGNATYFNASGVLTTAAINGPRFDHAYDGSSWVSKGLLVEEQRTSSVFYSEQFNLWTKSRCNVTANSIAAPDGNTTADLLTTSIADAVNQAFVYSNSAPSGQTTVSSSIFVKKGNCDYVILWSLDGSTSNGITLKVNISTGAIISTSSFGTGWAVTSSDIVNCGSGWYRFTLNGTKPSGSTAAILITYSSAVAVNAVLGDTVYLWGAQIEAGSFPTSYIPTTTAAVTRSADVCQITGGDFSGFWNSSEGSVVATYDRIDIGSGGPFIWTAGGSGGYNNNAVAFSPRLIGSMFFVYSGGSEQANYSIGAQDLSFAQSSSSIAYKVNDFAGSLNGAAVVTDSAGLIPTVSRLDIGFSNDYPNAPYKLNGHIARLRYFNTRLTNSQLQVLST